MEKLELKHLSPYLPYGLELRIETAIGNSNRKLELDCGHDFNLLMQQGAVKPYLRPMDDLTSEITHNGEKLVPIEVIDPVPNFFDVAVLKNHPLSCPYELFLKLVELHFDVFGLIPQGLALNINYYD